MTHSLYKGTVEIDFKENPWHIYTLIKSDKVLKEPEKLLSVTGATGIIDKSAALVHWATHLAADYLNDLLAKGKEITSEEIEAAIGIHKIRKDEAADTGSQIHDWIEGFITLKKAPALPTDPKVLNGVTAFLKWIDENDVEFLESETLVYSKKYKYVGKLDAIAKIKGKLTLIDYKSSKGIYSGFLYQTALYRAAKEEETGKVFTGDRMILKLGKEDGEFKVHHCTDYERDLKAGLACVIVKKRENELSKLIRELNPKK